MHTPEIFEARVVSARPLSPNVREIVLERADRRPFAFDPGQWVNLVLPLPGEEIRRAYSIASAPDSTSHFALAVTLVTGGPGSEYLHAVPEGTLLRAVGPHGMFTRAPGAPRPSLFVATGTGVSPLRSMMQAALGAGDPSPMWLLFGARCEADILYEEEMRSWASAHPNVRFDVTLSRPSDAWAGRRGHVQAHVPELLRALEASCEAPPHVYVCGLDRMVKSVRELVRGELGVDRKRVHVERYD